MKYNLQSQQNFINKISSNQRFFSMQLNSWPIHEILDLPSHRLWTTRYKHSINLLVYFSNRCEQSGRFLSLIAVYINVDIFFTEDLGSCLALTLSLPYSTAQILLQYHHSSSSHKESSLCKERFIYAPFSR